MNKQKRRHISATENMPVLIRPHTTWNVYVRRIQPDKKTYSPWITVQENISNILVDSGRDYVHSQIYTNTSATTRGAGYIALTQTAVTPATSDVSLSGEISTNGLQRADATTKSHTTGTNSTLIEHTFTASGAFTTVQAGALFTASSGGTMLHEFIFTSTALASGDQLKISVTANAG